MMAGSHAWRYMSAPQRSLNDRSLYLPRGKVLGGGSSINGMVYDRGMHSDYDRWAQAGNEGWSFAEVLPYFRKLEHFGPIDDGWHGQHFFFFNDPATTEIYTLSLLDALPISALPTARPSPPAPTPTPFALQIRPRRFGAGRIHFSQRGSSGTLRAIPRSLLISCRPRNCAGARVRFDRNTGASSNVF